MAIIFKYKNKSSLSYAPGFATPGNDGNEGKQGVSGNTVYFVDYDLDNSYSIQLALQRIENNQILSTFSNKTMPNRPYKENDLLISKNGKVYKIVLANVTSAQNYKYDIQYIGTIRDKEVPPVFKILLCNITGNSITFNNKSFSYNSKYNCPVPSNRESDGIVAEDLCGIWIKIFLLVTPSTLEEDMQKACIKMMNEYSYHLTIYLKNKKSLQGNSAPVDMSDGRKDPSPDELQEKLNFYKKLEFDNLVICPITTLSNNPTFNTLASIEAGFADKFNMIDGFYPGKLPCTWYLSDSAMDKMHPSGNNIKFTGVVGEKSEDPALWFKSGVGMDSSMDSSIYVLPTGDAYEFPYVEEGTTPTVDDIKFTKCEYSNLKYYYSGAAENNEDSPEIVPETFDKYSIGGSLSKFTVQEAQEELDDENLDIVQESARRNTSGKFNMFGGDSRYFSSLSDLNSGAEVRNELFSYLTNDKENKYILTVKNKKTNELYTVEIPVEFVDLSR